MQMLVNRLKTAQCWVPTATEFQNHVHGDVVESRWAQLVSPPDEEVEGAALIYGPTDDTCSYWEAWVPGYGPRQLHRSEFCFLWSD